MVPILDPNRMDQKFKQWLDGCAVASGLLGGGVRRLRSPSATGVQPDSLAFAVAFTTCAGRVAR